MQTFYDPCQLSYTLKVYQIWNLDSWERNIKSIPSIGIIVCGHGLKVTLSPGKGVKAGHTTNIFLLTSFIMLTLDGRGAFHIEAAQLQVFIQTVIFFYVKSFLV